MLFASATVRSAELRVRAAVRFPVRAARVVVPAREPPAVPESLAQLVLEVVPRAGDSQPEAVVLRLLFVADPVRGGGAVGLLLVDHAARRAVLAVRDAVRREDARGDRPHLRHLEVLALEPQRLPLQECFQSRLEQRLVLLDPEAVLLRELVARGCLWFRVGMIAAGEIA